MTQQGITGGTMTNSSILYSEDKGIALVTLNRPEKVNAMNREMIDGLDGILDALERSGTARVVILTGAGEKGFCSGLDMKETAASMMGQPLDVIYRLQLRTSRLLYKMRTIPQPVIAAVHGAASGAGFSFTMASDIRIITPAARFNAAYINIGLGGADLASSYFLPRLIGSGRANEFLLTGDFMSADDAMNLGFASRVVPRDELMDAAFGIAGTMLSKNPLGLYLTKEAINQNLGLPSLEQALHLENRNQCFLIAQMMMNR